MHSEDIKIDIENLEFKKKIEISNLIIDILKAENEYMKANIFLKDKNMEIKNTKYIEILSNKEQFNNDVDLKYELIRIANSKLGSKLIKIILKLRINKLFK